MAEEYEVTAKEDVDSEEVDKLCNAKKNIDDDDDNDDKKEDPLMNASDVIGSMRNAIDSIRNIDPPMPFFMRPKQRQYWGDIQAVPHKEWGDIFFDLFYVAGAYNLGNLLREDPSARGIFYFAACFFPIQYLWQCKMRWDSCYYTPSRDMVHQFYELCTLVALATAVLHIRPVALLSNPEEHQELFIFCASMCAGSILVMGRSIEVMVLIEEEPVAVIASKRDAIMHSTATIFFAAATIYAGVKHFGDNSGDSSSYASEYGSAAYGESTYDSYNATSDAYNTTTAASSEYHEEEDHHFLFRLLAGASSYGGDSKDNNNHSGDIAMALLLAGFCVNHLCWYFVIMFFVPYQGNGDPKSVMVPMNIDYVIHRYGEWVMLMLGETVLSLLIVGVFNKSRFYEIFYCGVLSISLLQIMHFRSQPHHADDHAMRRNKNRGYFYVILVQVYSAALIILGASYKMLLYEFVYEADYGAEAGYESGYVAGYGMDSGHGYDSAYGNETSTYGTDASYHADDGHRRLMAFGNKLHRWLAGGGGGGGALRFDKDDRIQRVANLFCGSMAAVWLLSDLLILVHKGVKENMQRCKDTPVPRLVKLVGIPLLLLRVGLVVFMATLSLYLTESHTLAFVGLMGIVVQIMLRTVGTALYREEDEDDDYEEILKHGLTGEQSMAFQIDED